ncbi:MAG: cytochrome C oxidase subunit IV family protein [Rhodospirillales bacterium]|nr:cytochrome C oxidase subunit IV family protein [Rhodospirillales bacterium]
MNNYPSVRILLLAWAAMMILTLGTMFAGQVTEHISLSALWLVVLAVIAVFKSSFVLHYYLNLRVAPREWKTAFDFFLIVLLATIGSIFIWPS